MWLDRWKVNRASLTLTYVSWCNLIQKSLHKVTSLTFTETNWSVILCRYVKIVVFIICVSTVKQMVGAERYRWRACQPLLFMLLLWDTNVMSAPHNHRDWLMYLITRRMFWRINLHPKNKRFAFSSRNVDILCGFTNNTNSSSIKYIFIRINCTKKSPRCVTALSHQTATSCSTASSPVLCLQSFI